MKDLRIAVKAKWFHQIASGEKTAEYRIFNEFWRKRLAGKEFRNVIITLGYPKKNDPKRTLVFKWRGHPRGKIVSEEFGSSPVRVYAIDLSERLPTPTAE